MEHIRSELSKAFHLPVDAKHDCQRRKNYRCELSTIKENSQRTRVRFLFFSPAAIRDIADAIKCWNRLLKIEVICSYHMWASHTKRTTKVMIHQPSNIVDNSRFKRLTHKSSLILSTACQHKRRIFRTRINSPPCSNRVATTMWDITVSPLRARHKSSPVIASVAIQIVKVSSSRRDECGSRRAATPASPRPGIMDAFHFR